MVLTAARKWMSRLEEYPMGLARWFLIFMSVVFVRDILEGFSGRIPFVHPIDFFIHYPLAFLNPILALSIVLAIFSQVNVLRVTKLMLFVSAAVFLMPPLLDLAGAGLAGAEGGSHIGYLYLERTDYLDHVINFFNPFRGFQGTTAGIRIEAFVSCLLAFAYVLIKSGRVLRGAGAFVVVYFVSLTFFTYPYNWYHLFGDPETGMSGVRSFFEGNGVVLRHFFDPQSFSFASLHILLLALLSTLWTAAWSPGVFYHILRRTLSTRFLFSLFLAGMGVTAAWRGFYPVEFDSEKLGLFDAVSLLQAAFALLYLNLFRSSLGEFTESGDRQKRIPRRAAVAVSAASVTLALLMAAGLHYAAFTIIMSMLGIIMLLHVKPLQLRRWPAAGAIIEGLFWVLAWLFGFALLARAEAPALMDRRFAWISMATLTAFSLWRMGKAGMRTISGEFSEDFRFLRTFEKAERLLPFIALPAASLGGAFIFRSPWLAAAGILTGCASAAQRVGGDKSSYAGRLLFLPLLAGFLVMLFFAGLNNPGVMSKIEPSTGTERFHQTFAHKLLWDGYSDHALLEYEAAVASGSRVLEMYTTLAYLYEQKNLPERAVQVAELAVERLPDKSEAWTFLGDKRMLLERYESAARSYSTAIELQESSPDPEILRKSGLAFELAGNSDIAFGFFERAHKLCPEDYTIASAYWSLAFSIASQSPGKPGEADFWLRISKESDSLDSLYLAARYLDNVDDPGAASACYGRIEKMHPDEVPAQYLHSHVYSRMDEQDLAIEYMKRVVERTGSFIRPVQELGLLLQMNDRPDEAIEVLSAFLAGPGADIGMKGAVLLSLGFLKAEAGELGAAAELFQDAFSDSTVEAPVRSGAGDRLAGVIVNALDGDTVVPLKTGRLSEICSHPVFELAAADSIFGEAFARSLAEEKRPAEAVCAYYRLTTAFPGYIRALFNYGLILEELGRFGEALILYEKINDLKEDHTRAWVRRAICLVRQGKNQEGIESARFCLKISPDFKPAQKMIETLESGGFNLRDGNEPSNETMKK